MKMMYKTHIEFGKNFFWLSLPIVAKAGVIPNILHSSVADIILAEVAMYVGYRAAIWGSGFPDIDKEGTEADKKNPYLGKFIRAFGVHHRGKFSHSLDSMTLLFSILALIAVYAVPSLFISMLHYLPVEVMSQINNLGIVNMVMVGGAINKVLLATVVFAYVGVVSHLFADLPTGGGVRLFFFMKPFKVKSKFFRTGDDSTWELFCRKSAKILMPISILVSTYLMSTL